MESPTHHLREIVSLIVAGALKKYKIDAGRAEAIVTQTIGKYPKFLQLLQAEQSLKKIMGSRLYQEVYRESRHRIYYALRHYTTDSEVQKSLIEALKNVSSSSPLSAYRSMIAQLAQTHVSVRERCNSPEALYTRIFEFIGEPGSIIDVGCGMHPLVFPFETHGKSIHCYAALDKEPLCIEALCEYSRLAFPGILRPLHWNIKQKWGCILESVNIERFDTAFLMKLVPVVSRIERELIHILLQVPARRWVITGSRVSMTRHQPIEGRERRIINAFIDESGKTIMGEFLTDDEFGFVIE
ncbi:MAG: hypothetical protein ACM3SY_08225 [Candidatus Omnitrophota bacterium]